MVHWDRARSRRRLLLQIICLLCIGFGISMFYEVQHGYSRRLSPLSIVTRHEVPLKEISGMAVIKKDQDLSLAFISDRRPELLLFQSPGAQSTSISFKPSLLNQFSLCHSDAFDECAKLTKKLVGNWEALATDGTGRFFLLQEHSQTILIYDAAMKSVENVLHFNFADAFPDLVSRGSRKFRTNSLGEGMILMKNGHFLVAKEQYPLAFVEFGPADEPAAGFHKGLVLGPHDAFPVGDPELHVEYKPLATWILGSHSKCDISDLAIGNDGELLALSSVCGQIQVYRELVPKRKVESVETIELPGEIKNPEALSVVGDQWLVASDIPNKRESNFFILKKR